MELSYTENLGIPYIGPMPKLHDGTMTIIQGNVPRNCKRFHINLSVSPYLNEKCETALHLNPRFEGVNQVVRNSYIQNRWGVEERGGAAFPLRLGENFEVIILSTNGHFKVAFNGQHFCEFKYRMPKERVTSLVVEGDVKLNCLKFRGPGIEILSQAGNPNMPHGPPQPVICPPCGPQIPPPSFAPGFRPPGSSAPPAYFPPGPPQPGFGPPTSQFGPPQAGPLPPPINLTVPLRHPLAGGLYPGRMIHVSGVPHSTSSSGFSINLKTGEGPKADIAFHFNVRFKERVIVRNTMIRGGWGPEERNVPNFPFGPGLNFDIIIRCEAHSLKVAVNNAHFIEYKHRVKDLNSIRLLEVVGELRLTNVNVP